jgi:hypothetical protein
MKHSNRIVNLLVNGYKSILYGNLAVACEINVQKMKLIHFTLLSLFPLPYPTSIPTFLPTSLSLYWQWAIPNSLPPVA